MDRYVGVVTTGIYCCPGRCSGRPLEGNRRWFSSPAAAEAAGYRACHVCRPYRTEPGWSMPAPELVCEALRLTLAGALDRGGSERDLAEAVGVSARHLRRLFEEHLGATPTQIARSARAHFARRLIDDTDLTFTEIAYMAAFGSVRQFNTVMREVFRVAPTELRARRRRADRIVTDGGLVIRLPHDDHFDFPATLQRLATTTIPGVSQVEEGTYSRTFRVFGDPAVVEVSAGSAGCLHARFHLPHWTGLLHHVQRLQRLLRLGPFDAGTDTGRWDRFEYDVSKIFKDHTAQPERHMANFVLTLGEAVEGLGTAGLTHLFPAPVQARHADLISIGLPPPAARLITDVAEALCDTDPHLDPLARAASGPRHHAASTGASGAARRAHFRLPAQRSAAS